MTNLLMKNIVHTESACIKTKTAITYSSTAPLLNTKCSTKIAHNGTRGRGHRECIRQTCTGSLSRTTSRKPVDDRKVNRFDIHNGDAPCAGSAHDGVEEEDPMTKCTRSARRPQVEKYSQYRLWSVAELIKNNTVKQYAKTLKWIGKQEDVEEGLQEVTNETDLANLAIPKQTCIVADHVVNSHSLPCKAWAPLWLQQSWSSLGSRDSWALPTAPAPLAAAKPAVPADALASTGRPCEQPIFVELNGTKAPCSPEPRDEHGVEQAD
uniref:Uncharacterized protein n=1 Tax=Oryza rufipogon TaxID=4529 RepID=A0A0E0NBL7_ORYRU